MPNLEEILTDITDKLVNEFSPRAVYLFGSYAWGEPNLDSDIDIFVEIDDSSDSKAKRATKAYRALRDYSYQPMDILVRTKEECLTFINIDNSLISKILISGKKLYERTQYC